MVFLDENGFNFNNWVRRGEGHSHEEIAMGKHRSWLYWEHFTGPHGFSWNKRREIRWRFPLKQNQSISWETWWFTKMVFFWRVYTSIHSIVRPSHVCWKNCAEFPCRYGLGWLRPSDEEDGRSTSSRPASWSRLNWLNLTEGSGTVGFGWFWCDLPSGNLT